MKAFLCLAEHIESEKSYSVQFGEICVIFSLQEPNEKLERLYNGSD